MNERKIPAETVRAAVALVEGGLSWGEAVFSLGYDRHLGATFAAAARAYELYTSTDGEHRKEKQLQEALTPKYRCDVCGRTRDGDKHPKTSIGGRTWCDTCARKRFRKQTESPFRSGLAKRFEGCSV